MSEMTTETRRRPLGISIVAIFLALSGFMALTGAMLNFVSVSKDIGRLPNHMAALLLTLGTVSIVLSAMSFGLTYGLWTLKRWAFWFTIALEIILLIQNTVLWYLNVYTVFAFAINCLPSILIIAYFFLYHEVRSAFEL